MPRCITARINSGGRCGKPCPMMKLGNRTECDSWFEVAAAFCAEELPPLGVTGTSACKPGPGWKTKNPPSGPNRSTRSSSDVCRNATRNPVNAVAATCTQCKYTRYDANPRSAYASIPSPSLQAFAIFSSCAFCGNAIPRCAAAASCTRKDALEESPCDVKRLAPG